MYKTPKKKKKKNSILEQKIENYWPDKTTNMDF